MQAELGIGGAAVQVVDLRTYQDASVEGLRDGIRAGLKNQVLCSPTGSGKSVLAVYLLQEALAKGRRALFIAERITLIQQFSDMLDAYGVPHGVIQGDHWRTRPGELIQVASAQSLARRGWPAAELIIIDEAHIFFKNTLAKIAQKQCVTVGLTATPFTKGMGKHYEGVVNVTTTNKLTADGFLVPFKVWAAAEPDMTGAKTVAGEWTDAAAEERATPIVGDVVSEYMKRGNGGKFIAFGVTVKHCAEIRRQMLAAGVLCELHTYQEIDAVRDLNMKEFRRPDSKIRGLISVSALSRGLDVPDVSVIIACRPLKSSLAEHIQVIGRGLRPHPGKEHCVILDLAGNCVRHWSAMHDFFEHGVHELDDGKVKEKKKLDPKEKQPRKCPQCSHVFPGGPSCPACGFMFPVKAIVHAPGELRELNGVQSAKPMDRAAKEQLFGELKWICRERGYKPGWASVKFREYCGAWPNAYGYVGERPASPDTLAMVRSSALAWAASQKKAEAVMNPIHSLDENHESDF